MYKTQVRELTDELDESKERQLEVEREKQALVDEFKDLAARADQESQLKRVAVQDIADLEKEKMMIELELNEVNSKHKSALRNLEQQLAASKDTESDLLQVIFREIGFSSSDYFHVIFVSSFQRLDMFAKDNDELKTSVKTLTEELEEADEKRNHEEVNDEEEMEKMRKALHTEKMLKQQAVNKLAEIMNRKETAKNPKADKKATSAELRKKEKENRRLQQELGVEKEKFNQMVAKYQKDLQDLQVRVQHQTQCRKLKNLHSFLIFF